MKYPRGFEIKESRQEALPPVRVTFEERRAIEAEADRLGLSLSNFIRKALWLYLRRVRVEVELDGGEEVQE